MVRGVVMAKYKYDLFVSFSHLDDRSPSNECGCVTALLSDGHLAAGDQLGRLHWLQVVDHLTHDTAVFRVQFEGRPAD
jgi:hypothetical protein